MKKVKNILMAAGLVLFSMTACDIVEEPYLQGGGGGGTGGGDDTTSTEVVKKVLLEDCTGVRCVNCPAASEVAAQLKDAFGERLIVLGVHAGSTSIPYNPASDFRTEEGSEWYSFFGFDVNPIGTVNRISTSGSYGLNSGNWSSAVAEELAKDVSASIAITNTYDAVSRNLIVEVKSKLIEDQTEDLYLVVCLMEDSIVAPQQTPAGVNPNYVHRHVFRGTLNGTWGGKLASAPVVAETEFSTTYTYAIPETFAAENCAVIAYLYQGDSKAIIQAEEKTVIE
jgi:Outer membrane protein Omp28.